MIVNDKSIKQNQAMKKKAHWKLVFALAKEVKA